MWQIADFGVSSYLEDDSCQSFGTPAFQPPEVFEGVKDHIGPVRWHYSITDNYIYFNFNQIITLFIKNERTVWESWVYSAYFIKHNQIGLKQN